MTHKIAGPSQGFLLISIAWLAPLGSVLFAPVLPQIVAHFNTVPNAELLAPMALATPALFVALLSPVAGILADKVGRKRLLLIAICAYALAGTAPMWLDNLYLIISSRVLVGISEAAVMTASTALICDYFDGQRRANWLAMQFGTAAIVATVCFASAGLLGNFGWRAPFAVYGATLLFVPMILLIIFEPDVRTRAATQAPSSIPLFGPRLLLTSALTVLCGIFFYVTPVHISFVLAERGISEPSTLGLVSACGSIGVVAGALLFRSLPRMSIGILLTLAFALETVGFAIICGEPTLSGTVVGMFINNTGCGLSLPLVLAWSLASLPPAQRGRGSGIWTSAFFIGQFACPIVVGAARAELGSMSTSLAFFAAVACVTAIATALAAALAKSFKVPASVDPSMLAGH